MTTLCITGKQIEVEACPVLYDRPFSAQSLDEDWEARHADWRYADGAFIGRNPLPGPGCLLSRGRFPGNVLLDLVAETVLPSTHDIDVMWNVSWDEERNLRGTAYVAGIQGWWDGKVGIEKSPAYALMALAPCPWFRPGQPYHIQAGSINGHCFVFVDGALRLELMDPDPIDAQLHSRVGFEAYQSQIRVSSLTVRQIAWTKRTMGYAAEF